MMGVVFDVVNIGDWNWLCMWVLVIGVVMIGIGCLSWFGLIDISKMIYMVSKFLWLFLFVGGLLFGFGMVLGLGCGSKMLVCIGGGNFKLVVVFVFLGLVVYMMFKGVFGVVCVVMVDSVVIVLLML